MNRRREVRVAPSFFAELDQQLGDERGPDGEPSATDFIVLELPTIVEEFASNFDNLPEPAAGVSAARMFISVGRLVGAFVVHGIETTEGIVHLTGIDVAL
ncbi:MAG: hypothetical protein R2710_22795 [Acidimicrobiales bacterium]